jgi:NAD(P)-dependent dehydrogenase (short-subunit alcohol dehydrogenase family)
MAGARKVAIITGAARGIGAGVAQGLAKAGYTVSLVGLEGDLLRQKAREIGEGAIAFEVDVTDRYSMGNAVEGTRERFGRIDAVVSNAGISNFDLLRTMAPEHFRRVMAVNVEGTFNAIQATLPHLIESRGYFLGVASIAAAMAPPGMAAYGASKGATENLCNTFRAEVSHLGIDVGVAYFGWLDTDLVRTGNTHKGFSFVREHLPGPLRSISSLEIATAAIVDGVVATAAARHGTGLAPVGARDAVVRGRQRIGLQEAHARNRAAVQRRTQGTWRRIDVRHDHGPDAALISLTATLCR